MHFPQWDSTHAVARVRFEPTNWLMGKNPTNIPLHPTSIHINKISKMQLMAAGTFDARDYFRNQFQFHDED